MVIGVRSVILIAAILLITSRVSAQWAETRRVFAGQPDERTISVPYYMPFAAEPDMGWGFYYDWGRLPQEYRTPEYQRLCMRHMASIGLNTLTIYGWWGGKNLDDVHMQLRLAKEEGLAKRPVLILPCGEPRDIVANLHLPPDGPEIIGYGPDEPGDTDKDAKNISDSVASWHEVKMRVATAISADHAVKVGDPLDIWIVQTANIGNLPPTKKELWAYSCEFRGTNALLHRYLMGAYAYALHRRLGVKALFLWAYVNDAKSGVFREADGTIRWNPLRVNEHALPGPDGPITTVGMDGMREGIIDFKLLHELERRGGNDEWLNNLVKEIPLNFWDGTDSPKGPEGSSYYWDVPDTATPRLDVGKMREETCRLLHLPSPD